MFTFDHYDENYEDYIEGYTKEKVYQIILKILDGNDDDENIDLLEEIKALNLDKCYVETSELEKKYYVLIIGGSNKEMIDVDSFITNSKITTGTILTHLLEGLPQVKVELLENSDTYSSQELKKVFPYTNICGYRFFTYTTLKELQEKLQSKQHVPFDLIINTANLHSFSITDNKLTTTHSPLDLHTLFPNSYIINIQDFHTQDNKELLIHLISKIIKLKSKL